MLEFPNLDRGQIARALETLVNSKSCKRCKHFRDGMGCSEKTYKKCRSRNRKHRRLFEEG